MTIAKGTVLVTGANGGLGSAIADLIASRARSAQSKFAEYHGLYTVRDTTLAPVLHSVLSKSPSHSHDVVSLDLTKLDSVRQVAETINARVTAEAIPPIRALILNAGFQDFGKQIWTDDGLDVTFAANYLGHWLLALLLLKSMDKMSGRIVVVGSQSHDPYDKRNEVTGAFVDEKYRTVVHDQAGFEAIAKGTWSSAQEDPTWQSEFRRYGAAKLFSVMIIHELQQPLDHDPVLSNIYILGVDPGTMSTSLQRHAPWAIRIVMFKIIYPIIALLGLDPQVRSTQKSASQVLRAAVEASKYPRGSYFFDDKPLETGEEFRNVQKRELVWKESIRYANLQPGETVLSDWQ
ncbi:hypothetical protein SLS62_011246 [Diatrype stigma]|uniref:3beta-hydroxysteroid 3-dehydrogenase n=1 Tax=Diatrype stigma TaxID=117547 RepID=A0AAN9YFJ7_9PEZI